MKINEKRRKEGLDGGLEFLLLGKERRGYGWGW